VVGRSFLVLSSCIAWRACRLSSMVLGREQSTEEQDKNAFYRGASSFLTATSKVVDFLCGGDTMDDVHDDVERPFGNCEGGY
jgi:hypothetical protein